MLDKKWVQSIAEKMPSLFALQKGKHVVMEHDAGVKEPKSRYPHQKDAVDCEGNPSILVLDARRVERHNCGNNQA